MEAEKNQIRSEYEKNHYFIAGDDNASFSYGM